MSSTESGRKAEQVVVQWLEQKGHKILDQNWRTRWCEIDIVSIYNNSIYFTEVKFRSSQDWGSGLEYITPKKLKQMHFAAEFWLSDHQWQGDAQLCAVEVDQQFTVNFIDF